MSGPEPNPPTESPPVHPERPSEVAGAVTGAVVGFLLGGPIGGVLGGGLGHLVGRNLLGENAGRSDGLAVPIAFSSKEAATICRTDEELARELVELENQFDPPERGASSADARWFEANWGAPVLAAYRGTHVAVLNGAIVGHGSNALQLELDVARKFNLHPQRFIVEYVPTAVSE